MKKKSLKRTCLTLVVATAVVAGVGLVAGKSHLVTPAYAACSGGGVAGSPGGGHHAGRSGERHDWLRNLIQNLLAHWQARHDKSEKA